MNLHYYKLSFEDIHEIIYTQTISNYDDPRNGRVTAAKIITDRVKKLIEEMQNANRI